MSKNVFPAILLSMLFSLAFPVLAGSDSPVLGKRATVSFSSEVHIGEVHLEPGQYRIQHVASDQAHFLVFREHPRGREVGRIPCEILPLAEKNQHTELHSVAGKLTEIRIKGEEVGHLLLSH